MASWDMRAVPLGRGTFRLSWVVREIPDVSLVRYATATSVREAYVKEPGSTAFVLVLPGDEESFRVRGRELEPRTVTLLQPGAEYEVVSPAGGEALEVYVPDELVAQLGLDRWLDPDVVNVRPDAALAAQFAARVAPLVTEGRELAFHPAAERAAILETLAATLDSVDPSAAPAPTVRLHAIYRRAVAAIESDLDPMLTVVELAARLGVTTRTLRYAFRYALGLSPYQFMLARRLTLMRDTLLDTSRPERTVLDLLLAHGITHQGEFAGQYRRLFGESPSQTRAAALGRRRDRPSSAGAWPHILRVAR
jgi:AraC family ethanolamine operon transcriptional activator